MRFHTAPLIAFTAYLEKKRHLLGPDHPMFSPGKQFSCYVKSVTINKTNRLENLTKYRSYSRLTFTYTHTGYEFKLDPGGFLSMSPHGIVKFLSGHRYEIVRYGSWAKEAYVTFSVEAPSFNIRSGTYNNWHLERGSFSGSIDNSKAWIKVDGPHYKRDVSSPYYHLPERDRMTTWNFTVESAGIIFPTV